MSNVKCVLHTNMTAVRRGAKMLLNLDIQDTKLGFVATHPFTNSWVVAGERKADGGCTFWDLHKEEELKKWRERLEKEIDKADVFHLFMMMNTPYVLTLLMLVDEFISDKDLGKVLGSFWTRIEQISLDKNITGQDIISWFSRAEKDELMEEEELEAFKNLPDEVTIYRGVTSHNKSKKKAFSWTTDRKVAEWFANRFQTGTGEVWTLTVPKERILCYFEQRGESEVITNLYGFNGKPTIEKI